MGRISGLVPGFFGLFELAWLLGLGDGADGLALLWQRQRDLGRHAFVDEPLSLCQRHKLPSRLNMNILRHFGDWDWCVVMVLIVFAIVCYDLGSWVWWRWKSDMGNCGERCLTNRRASLATLEFFIEILETEHE